MREIKNITFGFLFLRDARLDNFKENASKPNDHNHLIQMKNLAKTYDQNHLIQNS